MNNQGRKNYPPVVLYVQMNDGIYSIDRTQINRPKPVVQNQPQRNQNQGSVETFQNIDFQKNTAEPVQVKKLPVVIPSCSQWFSLESIHQIEKDSLQEYFQKRPSKTPEIYQKYRNFIVNLYRENPKQQLTATQCRKYLAGDACSIIRIHAFLEHWGLINFNVDLGEIKSELLEKSKDQEIFRFRKGNNDQFEFQDQSLTQQQKELVLNSTKMLSKNYQPFCDFCGLECSMLWYQFKKHQEIPEINLCNECYSQNRYPSFIQPEDFTKIDVMEQMQNQQTQDQKPWQLEETSKLLDLIQKYQNNWNQISQEFGNSRTKDELLMHFMQLPIKNITSLNLEEDQKQHFDNINQAEPNVFSDFSNPLLQHVAIFKSLLDNSDDTSTESQKIKQVEKKTVENCEILVQNEDKKVKNLINSLIDIQLNKLEYKLNYLEEYEKIIWTEKNNVEQLSQTIIADRIALIQKKINLQNNQNGELNHI